MQHTARVTILETERLALRQLDANGDAEFMVEVLNEPAFIKYVADRGVRTPADATKYITENMLPSYAKFGFGFYVVELKDTRVPIGICGLIKRDALNDVDIGFSTLREYWGRGYAYEAASALLEHGRRVHGLPRIVGITAPDNDASMNLLQKLGLRFERMIQLPGQTRETRLFT
jgi:RimJ/RimL family protein N-acetyltransferase